MFVIPAHYCPQSDENKKETFGHSLHPFCAVEGGSGQKQIGGIADDNVRYFSHIEKMEVARQVG
jgi:hypothetical protein